MAKVEPIELSGIVTECLPDAQFLVQLEGTNHVIMAYIGGKMRKFQVRVVKGDKVRVEMSPYDMTKGRICFRENVKSAPPKDTQE